MSVHTNSDRIRKIAFARKTANQTLTAGQWNKLAIGASGADLALTVPPHDNLRVDVNILLTTGSNGEYDIACSPDSGTTKYFICQNFSLNNVYYPFAGFAHFTAAQVPPGSSLTFWVNVPASVNATAFGAAVGTVGNEKTSVVSCEAVDQS
jgi:hypothetical protein